MQATKKQPEGPPFAYLPSEPWLMDGFSITEEGGESRVEMTGWAFPDATLGEAASGQFLINGKAFAEISYPLHRPDVSAVFWQRQHAEHSGFKCVTKIPTRDLYPGGAMELTYKFPGPACRVSARDSWFKCDPAVEPPLPDEGRRFRVIGSHSGENFTSGGFTDFKRLGAAVRFFTGSGFEKAGRILDFGCGCGRVARYLSQIPGVDLTGIDIDAENVAWCSGHMAGKFVHTSIHPPTAFAANSFDVVYGISVFTHMREGMQDAWLAELNRITAGGGFVFVTVHGRTALDYAWQGPDVYFDLASKIQEQGLYVSDANSQLDGYAEHEGEYVNVFHAAEYIRQRWDKYFEVVEILPGFIYTHDLVVLRKRSGVQGLARKMGLRW